MFFEIYRCYDRADNRSKKLAGQTRYIILQRNRLRNSQGFSLLEMMIAFGIGAVLMYFLSDLLMTSMKSQKFIAIKYEALDVSRSLALTFSDNNNCTCQFADNVSTNPNFANVPALRFNSTITDGSQSLQIGSVYTGCAGGVNPPQLIAQEGQPVPGSRDLVVDKVELLNLKPTGSASEWQGVWSVSFRPIPGFAQIKPATAIQRFTINTASPNSPASARVATCGVAGGSSPAPSGTPVIVRFGTYSAATCPAGTTPTGCSAEAEKSCVPDANGEWFYCADHGGRGWMCFLWCR